MFSKVSSLPKVLIIEDEAIVAEDLAFKIKSLGYEVVAVASTGEEALRVVERSPADLVLLDIQLTGNVDGIEIANRLQNLCDPAIIFVTAHSDPETVKKAYATDPHGYILKPFGERDLAVQLALALHKHRADRALKKEIAERQQAQKQLQKSEAILLRAQRGAKAGVWDIDLRTGQFTWSEPYYELFGVDRSLKPSLDVWLSRIHPEDRLRIADEYKESIEKHREQDMEFRILKSDGTVRWIHRKGQVEFNEQGEAIRINGISFDITERKHAEEAVSAVALFPAQNPSPVLRVNRAGVLIYMNPASGGLLKDFHLHIGEPVPQDLRDWVQQSLELGRPTRVEYDIATCHYFITITPIVKENYSNLYWTDITERKRAEIALRESEVRFRTMADCTPILIWVNGPNGCEFVNKAYIEFVGVSGQIDVARYDWAAFIHPDDRHTYVRGYQQAVEMRAPFDQQFRFRRHDGQYRWMRSVGQPQISATGELVKYVGATIDITDIQHAQARLQQWNADLERSVNVKTGELLESQAQLRALATELNLAEQRERQRLATDLHDHLQQLLVLGKLKLARGKQVSDISPVVGRVVSETDQILSDALTYTRTLVTQLNPPILREHGLAAGLKWLTESMTKHDLVVSVTVEDNVDLPDDHAVLLFQSVRELLINSAKHSGTKKAWVMLKKQEKELVIEVRDEGVGFEISASGSLIPGGLSSKFGLFSIKERMRALGGSFNIQSTPGQGTIATLLLPIAGDASSKSNTADSRP